MKNTLLLLFIIISFASYAQRTKVSELNKITRLTDSSLFYATYNAGKKITNPSQDSLISKSIYYRDLSEQLSESISGATDYLDPVKSFHNYPIPTDGERYISNVTDNVISYDLDSLKYDSTIVVSGNATLVTDSNSWYLYDGVNWSKQATTTLWAKSGNNIFNTNTGNVGIGKSNPLVALDVNGAIYNTTGVYSGLTGNKIVTHPTFGWYRKSNTLGSINFISYTNNSNAIEYISGTVLGGKHVFKTKGIDALIIDSNQNIILSKRTLGTSDSIVLVENGILKYKIASSGSTTKINQILVKRLAKNDTVITNIDLIANNTLFPDADSVQFYLYGNFTATVNLFNNYTKVYASDAIITRTSANGGRLIDRNNVNGGYMRWDGGNITSYGLCYRNELGNNSKDIFTPKNAKSTNDGCIYAYFIGSFELGMNSNYESSFSHCTQIIAVTNVILKGSHKTTAANSRAIFLSYNPNYGTIDCDLNIVDNSTITYNAIQIDYASYITFKRLHINQLRGSTSSVLVFGSREKINTTVEIDYIQGGIGANTGDVNTFHLGTWDNPSIGQYGANQIIYADRINNFKTQYGTATIISQNITINSTIDDANINFKNSTIYISTSGIWLANTNSSYFSIFENCNIYFTGNPSNYSYAYFKNSTYRFDNCRFTNTQTSVGTQNGMFWNNTTGGSLIFNNCYFNNTINDANADFIKCLNIVNNIKMNNCTFYHINTSANIIDSDVIPNVWIKGSNYTNVTIPINQTITNKITVNAGKLDTDVEGASY